MYLSKAFCWRRTLLMTGVSVSLIVKGLTGCAASPADHAANVSEAAQYSAELQSCIDQAKPLAPADRLPAYQACACGVDAKHGMPKAAGCP